jgi:hypothetical protein
LPCKDPRRASVRRLDEIGHLVSPSGGVLQTALTGLPAGQFGLAFSRGGEDDGPLLAA